MMYIFCKSWHRFQAQYYEACDGGGRRRGKTIRYSALGDANRCTSYMSRAESSGTYVRCFSLSITCTVSSSLA